MPVIKQVIVVRRDLKLSPGKLAAQVAHAAVEAYDAARFFPGDHVSKWKLGGVTKVVVTCADERAMRKLAELAAKLEVPYALITDEGRTEIPRGTVTALGIGPSDKCDKVTGNLALL